MVHLTTIGSIFNNKRADERKRVLDTPTVDINPHNIEANPIACKEVSFPKVFSSFDVLVLSFFNPKKAIKNKGIKHTK